METTVTGVTRGWRAYKATSWVDGVPVNYRRHKEDAVDKFYRYLGEWRGDVRAFSLARDMFEHQAYKKIVRLGLPAVPLILDEISIRPSFLVFALEDITGRTPVPDSAAGNINEIVNFWLMDQNRDPID